MGVWTDTNEKSLIKLTDELKQDPKVKAAAFRRISGELSSITADIESLETWFGVEALESTKELIEDTQAKKKLANVSAEELFLNGYVEKTGSDIWRTMFLRARAFAVETGILIEPASFEEGKPCPLCQTPSNKAAAARLRTFDNFILGEVAKNAKQATEAVAQKKSDLIALNVRIGKTVGELLTEYSEVGEDEAVAVNKVCDYYDAAVDAKRNLLSSLGNLEFVCDATSQDFLEQLRVKVVEQNGHADGLDQSGGGNAKLAEQHAELTDKYKFHQQIEQVSSRRDDREKRLRLKSCARETNTRAISDFVRQRRQELVTPALQAAIGDEIKKLNLDHIPLSFEEATESGQSLFGYKLDGETGESKERVLSEGEQRALSIACFIGEMMQIPGSSGLIFDDPINSLDQGRIRCVSKRIVELVDGGRQVIVFTHNLVFLQELLSGAAENVPQVRTVTSLISKFPDDKFGIVSEGELPWIAQNVKVRMKVMQDNLDGMPEKGAVEDSVYLTTVKKFYADMRETWERLVEEKLLAGVVERYGPGIKTQSLKGVSVTDDDYVKVRNEMKKCSEYSGHDMARGRSVETPKKAYLRNDLENLRAYEKELGKRINDLGAQRRQLEKPPTGSFAT
jgi:hypothetical protein